MPRLVPREDVLAMNTVEANGGQADLLELPKFSYETVNITDLECITKTDPVTKKVKVDGIKLGSKVLHPTPRFWSSMFSRFQIGPSIFNYYDHAEVFHRIQDRSVKHAVGICTQETQYCQEQADKQHGFRPTLLGVTTPSKSVLRADEAVRILSHLDMHGAVYRAGVIVSAHPIRNNLGFVVGKDEFGMRTCLETPIDGYGDPAIFLALLRQICTNGMIAYSKSFKSGINIGKKDSAADTVWRCMDAFNNEDGFMTLKQRLEVAQQSHASVGECVRLAKRIKVLGSDAFNPRFVNRVSAESGTVDTGTLGRTLRGELMDSLWKRAGDLRAMYGTAQLDSISEKRMRALPATCSVYDLLSLTTEIATHQLSPADGRNFQGFFGDMISREFDLEDSKSEFGEFADFINPNSRLMRN
jgi:hypothetical protein